MTADRDTNHMKEHWDTITLAAGVVASWATHMMAGMNGVFAGVILLSTAVFASARAGVWVLKLRAAWRNRNRYSFFKRKKDEEDTDT